MVQVSENLQFQSPSSREVIRSWSHEEKEITLYLEGGHKLFAVILQGAKRTEVDQEWIHGIPVRIVDQLQALALFAQECSVRVRRSEGQPFGITLSSGLKGGMPPKKPQHTHGVQEAAKEVAEHVVTHAVAEKVGHVVGASPVASGLAASLFSFSSLNENENCDGISPEKRAEINAKIKQDNEKKR